MSVENELKPVKVVSRTGDGPEVIEYLDPVYWDGESPIKPGIFYRFKSREDKARAISQDPVLSEIYASRKMGKNYGDKVKRDGTTDLSVVTYDAYAAAFYTGGSLITWAGCRTSFGWPVGPCYTLYHVLDITETGLIEYTYTDGQAHDDYVFDGASCNERDYASAAALIWVCELKDEDYAEDYCP